MVVVLAASNFVLSAGGNNGSAAVVTGLRLPQHAEISMPVQEIYKGRVQQWGQYVGPEREEVTVLT